MVERIILLFQDKLFDIDLIPENVKKPKESSYSIPEQGLNWQDVQVINQKQQNY